MRKDKNVQAPSDVNAGDAPVKSWLTLSVRSVRAGTLAICLLSLTTPQQVQPASAQTKTPAIVTASELRAAPGADTPLQISLSHGEALPRQAVLVIRGLPLGVQLSEGRLFGPGVWVVSTNGIARLKVRIPADAKGEAALNVSLAALDGSILASTQIALVIASPNLSPRDTVPTLALPSVPRQLSPEERAPAMKLLEKAEDYMKAGNLIVARQLYQVAAERGLPEAALALAGTYDPQELAKIKNLVGGQADPRLARKWYEKARDLGSPEAQARLR